MKRYFVIMQNEWDNLYYTGEYHNLKDAIPDINKFLEVYNVEITELEEYASTFGWAFDKEIETPDGNFVMVRGFIFYD